MLCLAVTVVQDIGLLQLYFEVAFDQPIIFVVISHCMRMRWCMQIIKSTYNSGKYFHQCLYTVCTDSTHVYITQCTCPYIRGTVFSTCTYNNTGMKNKTSVTSHRCACMSSFINADIKCSLCSTIIYNIIILISQLQRRRYNIPDH